jgi:hypothetical protein
MSDRQAASADNGTIKDPADWTTGDEPMTGAQESYLHTLARQAGQEEEVPAELTKAEASEKIDELRKTTGVASSSPEAKGRKAARKS